MPDYEASIRTLQDNKYHYHTSTVNAKKTHAFVLWGMSAHHTESLIKTSLADDNLTVHGVYKMRTKGVPLFLVVTDATWTTTKLQKQYPRLLRTAITWGIDGPQIL